MLETLKKLIFPLIVVIGGFVLYSIFFKADPETSLLKKQTATSGDVLGTEIIKALNQISTLTLDRGVFEDPIFKTLIDRSELLKPQPVGRTNPFALIGGATATTTKTSTTTPARVTR